MEKKFLRMTLNKEQKLSVIIPVKNEGDKIGSTVENTNKFPFLVGSLYIKTDLGDLGAEIL